MVDKAKIARAFKEVVYDARKVMRLAMESKAGVNEKVNRNTLYNSNLYAQIGMNTDNISMVQLLLNDYYQYIDWERPPFHYGKKGIGWPPVDVIQDFCNRKGIRFPGCVYLISRSIFQKGHKRRDIITPFYDMVDEKYIDIWCDKLMDSLMQTIDEYFSEK